MHKTHYVTTADEAINFDLEDQEKLHQEIAMDLEKSKRGDSRLFQQRKDSKLFQQEETERTNLKAI